MMLSKKVFLNLLPLIFVIILASILRLWMLGQVPISMSDDEIREVYNAYSIAQTGKDAFGNFLPLVFKMDGANTYGQVPIYVSSLFFLVSDLNPFTSRLPFALSGIISVVFLYAIIRKIIDDKVALLSSFVLAVSVWSIQMTRFAIEIDMAVALYLAGIYFFLDFKKNTKILLLSMLFFFLAFYTYAATKILLVPILLILVWYRFKDLSKKHILIILITIILSFGSFAYLSITQDASSYSSAGGAPFFFMDQSKTSMEVELERRASNTPGIIETLYHNKLTYWTRVFTVNYLGAFSPQYLFLSQESNGIYSIWGRGEFYIFELPLALIGLFYLFLKKRKEFYLILMLLLISPLPSALGVNAPTWTSRSGFMLFWMCVLIGVGIFALLTLYKNKTYRYLIFIIISLLYLYAVVGYVSQYYFDWSKSNAKYFSKSTKDLVYLLNAYKAKGKEVVVSGAAVNTFMHYAFYNKINPKLIHENINNNPIKFDNFTLTQECLQSLTKNSPDLALDNKVYISSVKCEYKVKPSFQIKTYDNTEVVWNIYEK